MKQLNKWILFITIALFAISCKSSFKPASLEQIQRLKPPDLPLVKFNEFGEAYYKEHPCKDNIAYTYHKSDTSIEQYLLIGQLNYLSDLSNYYKNSLDSVSNDKSCEQKNERLIKIAGSCISEIARLRKDSSILYEKIKNIKTDIYYYDSKLLDICKNEYSLIQNENKDLNIKVTIGENKIFQKDVTIKELKQKILFHKIAIILILVGILLYIWQKVKS